MPYHQCPGCGVTSYSASAYSTASVCPLCSVELSADSKLDLAFHPGPTLSRTFAVSADAPRQAREVIAFLPLPWQTAEALRLVVSELVANSVKHAGLAATDQIELVLATDEKRVWVAVRDDGPGFSPTARNPDRPGGFGFMVVAGQSDTWGVDCEGGGCTVWCAIALEHGSDTAERVPTAEQVPDSILRVAL